MAGATIFVMYADGAGNVTISARDGDQGHVEPVPDATLQSGVTLLAGSGIVNGKMIANVHCRCPISQNQDGLETVEQRGCQDGEWIDGDSLKNKRLTKARLNMQTRLLQNLHHISLDLRI